jgi:tetratricopeptide (TPR) repeat protein
MKKLILISILVICGLSGFSQELIRKTDEAKILIEKGNAKAESGDWKGALADYDLAVRNDQKYAEAYYKRAIASQNLKDYRNAINDLSRAIFLNNSEANYYFARGMCFLEFGRKNDACIDLSKASGLGNPEAATIMQNNCN